MKITKVTIRVAELRKTREFENKRIEIEYSADVDEEETPDSLRSNLLKKLEIDVENAFKFLIAKKLRKKAEEVYESEDGIFDFE